MSISHFQEFDTETSNHSNKISTDISKTTDVLDRNQTAVLHGRNDAYQQYIQLKFGLKATLANSRVN